MFKINKNKNSIWYEKFGTIAFSIYVSEEDMAKVEKAIHTQTQWRGGAITSAFAYGDSGELITLYGSSNAAISLAEQSLAVSTKYLNIEVPLGEEAVQYVE